MATQTSTLKKRISQKEFTGISLEIDLYNCSKDLIGSEEHIHEYVEKILSILQAKAYGACVVVHHGKGPEDMGYSMFQITESFSISAHFIDEKKAAYISLFSDQDLDEEGIGSFSKNFFEADSYQTHKNVRF